MLFYLHCDELGLCNTMWILIDASYSNETGGDPPPVLDDLASNESQLGRGSTTRAGLGG